MKSSFFIPVLWILLCFEGFCQKYSLRDCLNEGLQNNYALETQNIDNQINMNEYRQAKSKYLPQINAGLTYFNYPGDLPLYIFPEMEGNIISGGTSTGTYPVSIGLRHNYSINLNIEQTLFDSDFFLKGRSQSLIQSTNDLLTRKAQEELIYSITKTYLEILKLRKKFELILVNQRRLNQSMEIVKRQIENDMAKPSDLEELEIRLTQTDINHEKLRIGMEKQLNFLKFQMGKAIDSEIEIIMDTTDFNFSFVDTLSIENHADIQLTSKKIQSEELKIKSASNEKLPELKAFAQLQYQSQGENINPFSDEQYWYNPTRVGLMLSIPIMSGFSRNDRIENFKLEKQKAENLAEQNNQYLKMIYQNAMADLELKRSDLREKTLNLALQKKIMRRKRDLFQNNLIAVNELLEQEVKVAEAENDKSDAFFDYLMAQVELLKTTGSLHSLLE